MQARLSLPAGRAFSKFGAMTTNRRLTAEINGVKLAVDCDEEGFSVDGERVVLEGRGGLRRYAWRTADGQTIPVYVEEETDSVESHLYTVYIGGEAIRVGIVTSHDERLQTLRKNTASSVSRPQIVRAPMPGLLKDVLVSEGETVSRGDSVCILEAMKMENELKAPDRLRVRRILVAPGAVVDKGTPLLELEPLDIKSDA